MSIRNKRYLPNVLRNDVFAADSNLYPQPPHNSLLLQETAYPEMSQEGEIEATFAQRHQTSSSRPADNVTSVNYGAIKQQPKGSYNYKPQT